MLWRGTRSFPALTCPILRFPDSLRGRVITGQLEHQSGPDLMRLALEKLKEVPVFLGIVSDQSQNSRILFCQETHMNLNTSAPAKLSNAPRLETRSKCIQRDGMNSIQHPGSCGRFVGSAIGCPLFNVLRVQTKNNAGGVIWHFNLEWAAARILPQGNDARLTDSKGFA